ncbi:amino acid ABC transporter permease [Vibrio sp. MEBiC08052]|uniref:amino acid ABC transporter permease n=1 Tax=Vibrio sp. MEBiC08052 TaxID=1761910 RepID=UPI0007407F86|nr:amino acid ABC transporter permease [Vibrio sp. MEBiC08052]KUI99584.1 amino acid ABC transporter permease [Vibrio sp. MEBiC08052]
MMDLSYFLQELWNARSAIYHGVIVTISISALAIILGTMLGVIVGLALEYGTLPIKFMFRVYIDIIRGTPVFVLILAMFYVPSAVGLNLDAFQAGVVALTIFCSSHIGEIVRGALGAIPVGQTEAAKAIGLTFFKTFIYVLLPQALRQILPTWVNTAAEMVKASTLLSIVGVLELMLTTQQIISRNFMNMEFYLFAGFIYFCINFGIEQLGRYVERKVTIS